MRLMDRAQHELTVVARESGDSTEVDVARRRLGRAIAEVRATLGLTQAQMAHKLDLGVYAPGGRHTSTGRSAMSRFESGQRTPDPELLTRIVSLHPPAEMELRALAAAATDRPGSSGRGDGRPADSADSDMTSVADREFADADQTATPTAHRTRRDAPGRPPAEAETQKRTARRRRTWLLAFTVLVGAALVLTTVVVFRSPGHHASADRGSTWTETTGSPAHTWANPATASGSAGPPLGPRQSVQVSCRVRGYVVQDGDPWWYRIESPPWNGHFYATSDAFYNNGATSGSFVNGVVVDEQVPEC